MKILLAISRAAFCFSISASANFIPRASASFPFTFDLGGGPTLNNDILTGSSNASFTKVTTQAEGVKVTKTALKENVAKIEITSTSPYVGAQFSRHENDKFFGVWEYPFNGQLENSNITYDLKGLGNEDGINWNNARAPFFISSAGYGVYVDTLSMGTYKFTLPGQAQFIFNASSLTYYVILPTSDDYPHKSIIQEYTQLSARIEMPPDSSYGPNFWSDDFEQDFHGSVSNAQENYYDVINHLYENKIRATSMFADRPYGTGNSSFGNFDFDPKFYPTPAQFIANLTKSGFDFQVWVANRAFLYTELYNASAANGWLFKGIDPVQFQGPALNLSIPAAYDYFKTHLKAFTNLGVKGFKIDRGEEGEMPAYEQNVQMGLFLKLTHDVMAEKWGVGNYYSFARSAVDRQRSLAGIWNGDSHSNFSGLQYSLASGIRAGLMGYSQWGSDTGGYTRDANSPTEELWARWMWFSAFSPVFEIMVGTNHTPWYDPYTSNLVSVLKSSTDVHMNLLPYIRSYTYQATQTGIPVIRALFLEYPDEDEAWAINDQYMFGEEILVAPIVTQGNTRSVYFPGGTKWLEYLTKSTRKQIYSGGAKHTISATTAEGGPVYVREGAIVVTGDLLQANAKWDKAWKPVLNIECFPSWDVRESSFQYWSRETNRSVNIEMEVSGHKGAGNVTLSYGNFGSAGNISSSFTIYVGGAVKTVPLSLGGGHTSISLEKSIWE